MNKHLKSIALVGLLGLAQQAQAIEIDLNSLGNYLSFNGTTDTFTFTQGSAVGGVGNPNIRIIGVNSDGFAPIDSVNDYGRITGTWGIGAVTEFGNQQSAAVTGGTGVTFSIFDGFPGNVLTATLTLTEIFSRYNANNTTSLGLLGQLTNISYTGSETDLQELRDTLNGYASLTFSFSFSGNRGLTQLLNGGVNSTGFNADLDAIPVVNTPDGGATIAMLGMGTLLLGAARRKFKA